MDPILIEKINRLWGHIYPHLSRFVAAIYRRQGGRGEGDVLEFGPFAGGIARGLLSLSSEFRVVVADTSPELFDDLHGEIRETPLAQRMIIIPSPLSPLAFLDRSFDLVVCRGAFFFLTPAILQEIYRVLRPGGCAIVGGGYGPDTPQDLIGEIADESKQLNLQLGKQWMTEGALTQMIQDASLHGDAEISTEGGLWVILKRGESEQEKKQGLADAFALGCSEIIALTGGGGKTALLFALAEGLCARGSTVITTSTTKIFEPAQEQAPSLVVQDDPEQAIKMVREKLQQGNHVTFAAKRFPKGKIGGADPQLIERMAQELPVDHIIVEADGARRLPLKAPGDQEPIIPLSTTLLIPIVGIDALGKPLNEEQAFRPERIAALTGAQLGDPITAHLIAAVMAHPQGLCKGVPPGARIIPLINKVETTGGLHGAREVAREVLEKGHQIERVVLGRLFFHHPIVEVMERSTGSEEAL
jgi:probable selenium-dependent hydroxylase accessory protein YqeC